jgi:hypothetical protein
MTVDLPVHGETPWDAKLNAAILDVDARVSADTGWRDIGTTLINGWYLYPPDGTYAGSFMIRRMGNRVLLSLIYVEGEVSTDTHLATLPPGFNTAGVASVRDVIYLPPDASQRFVQAFLTGGEMQVHSNWQTGIYTELYNVLDWQTDDAWPDPLPGVPGVPAGLGARNADTTRG